MVRAIFLCSLAAAFWFGASPAFSQFNADGTENTSSSEASVFGQQSTPGMLLEIWGPLNVEDVEGRDPSIATADLIRYVSGVPVNVENDGQSKIRADIYSPDRFSGVMHRFTNWRLSGVLLPPERGQAIVTTRLTSGPYTGCVAKTSFDGVPESDLTCDGFCWNNNRKTYEKALMLDTTDQAAIPFSVHFACHYASNGKRAVLGTEDQSEIAASVSLFYPASGVEYNLSDEITVLPKGNGPFGN